MTFDEARAAHPAWAFNVYAFDPQGDVILEVIDPDNPDPFTFTGPTLQAALDRAFPPPPATEPEPEPNAFD